MDSIIAYFVEIGAKNPDGSLVHPLGTTIQALGVTVGGLIGVFVTLAAFFVVMFLAVKLDKGGSSD